jgi:hypothetical protein
LFVVIAAPRRSTSSLDAKLDTEASPTTARLTGVAVATVILVLGALHVRSQSKFWPNSHHHPASWVTISGWVLAAVVVGSALALIVGALIFAATRLSGRKVPPIFGSLYFSGLILGALIVLGIGPMII